MQIIDYIFILVSIIALFDMNLKDYMLILFLSYMLNNIDILNLHWNFYTFFFTIIVIDDVIKILRKIMLKTIEQEKSKR